MSKNLVVDDGQCFSGLLSVSGKKLEIKEDPVSSGNEGLMTLNTGFSIDAIMSDCDIPEKTGLGSWKTEKIC